MTSAAHVPPPEPGGGVPVSGPLGDWVVVSDGRIGQVWAQHKTRIRWWVAFGGNTNADHFSITDLKPSEGEPDTYTDTGQELPL